MFVLRAIFVVSSLILTIIVLLTAHYPPWGSFWESRTLLIGLVGSLVGIIASIILPWKSNEKENPPTFKTALPLIGITMFWVIIISSFISYQNPANTPFNIPSWSELYLFILYVSCATAWFWWHQSGDFAMPGLLLVMLAGTADGMLFDHYHLSSTCLYLAMVAIWFGAIWIQSGIPSLKNPVFGGGLILIVITLLASIFGVNPGDSLVLVLRLLSGWMLAAAILSLRTNEEFILPIKLSLLSAGFLISLLTIIRYVFLFTEIGFTNSFVTRLTMLKSDYNALGSTMILPFALMISLKDKFTSAYKVLFWGLIFLLVIPIFFSYTKSVWLGIGGLLTIGFILTRKSWRRYMLALCLVILVLTIIGFVFPAIGSRMLNLDSVTSREAIWQNVTRAIAEKPILGYGPFNKYIHAEFARYLPFEVYYSSRTFINVHTHNLWLEITEATGFLGLCCVIAILVFAIRSEKQRQSWMIAGLSGLLITLTFMGGISSFNLIPLELWIFLALITKPARVKAGWFGLPLIIVLLTCMTGIMAEYYERNSQEAIRKGDLAQARVDILRAEGFNPLSMNYKGMEAHIDILEDDFTAAVKVYDQCIALSSNHPIWRARRGVGRIITGDYLGAVSDLVIATNNDYYGVLWLGDLHAPLAAALAMVDKNEEASEHLAISASIDPAFPLNPFSALVKTPDGYECCLCPDFSPSGSAFERYLRCKNWLLYYSFPSISSFRSVYPMNISCISYTGLLQEQLSNFDPRDYPTPSIIPKKLYSLGSALFYARVAEGRIGSDLTALFGSFEDIPPSLLRLLIRKAAVIDILGSHHIFASLGLSISAMLNGKMEHIQPLLDDAITSTEKALEDETSIKERRFSIERNSLIPIETPQLILFKANAYMKTGRTDQALETVQRLVAVLMMEGGGIDMAEGIADVLNSAGDHLQPTIRLLEMEFDKTPLIMLINGRLAKLRGDTPAAADFAKLAGREEQNNRPLQLIVIYELLDLGEIEKARQAALEYLEREPYDIDGLSNIAARLYCLDNGRISQAILDHLKACFPYTPGPYILEATLAEQNKNEKQQYDSLRQALALAPTNMAVLCQLLKLSIAKGDYAFSQELIKRGLQQNPGYLDLWMAKTELAQLLNQPTDALKDARFARHIYPEDIWATTTLVAQLLNLDKAEEALSVLDVFLRKQPGNIDAIRWRVRVLEKLGKVEEALAECEKILANGDADVGVYVELANLRIEQKRTDDAIKLMQQATAIYPNDAWGWATLGDIARRARDYDLARMALDKAIALSPENESYRSLLKDVEKVPLANWVTDCEKALAAGDKSGALTKAEAAVTEYPTESWAWANLAYMAHQAGNMPRARAAIAKAIELAPENKTWQKLRQEIEKH